MSSLKVKKKDSGHRNPVVDELKHELKEDVADVAREPMVRLNTQVPESMRRALKAKAAMDGRKIQDVVLDLLKQYLNEGTKIPS